PREFYPDSRWQTRDYRLRLREGNPERVSCLLFPIARSIAVGGRREKAPRVCRTGLYIPGRHTPRPGILHRFVYPTCGAVRTAVPLRYVRLRRRSVFQYLVRLRRETCEP